MSLPPTAVAGPAAGDAAGPRCIVVVFDLVSAESSWPTRKRRRRPHVHYGYQFGYR